MRCLRLVVIEIISPVNNSESKGALSVNFSSIAIELNVSRDEFSSIAIELTFVALRRGFKKSGSVIFHIGDFCDKVFFKSDYISLYLYNWAVLRLCIVFTIGESPRVCSKYSHWYNLLLIWGSAKVSSIELLLQDGQRKFCGFFWFHRDRTGSIAIELLCSRRTMRHNYVPHRWRGGYIVFGADPVGVGVSVGVSVSASVGVGVGVTLSFLHDISWTGGWILTKFAWM